MGPVSQLSLFASVRLGIIGGISCFGQVVHVISKLPSSIFAGISCFVRVASVVRQRREGVGSAPLIISDKAALKKVASNIAFSKQNTVKYGKSILKDVTHLNSSRPAWSKSMTGCDIFYAFTKTPNDPIALVDEARSMLGSFAANFKLSYQDATGVQEMEIKSGGGDDCYDHWNFLCNSCMVETVLHRIDLRLSAALRLAKVHGEDPRPRKRLRTKTCPSS